MEIFAGTGEHKPARLACVEIRLVGVGLRPGWGAAASSPSSARMSALSMVMMWTSLCNGRPVGLGASYTMRRVVVSLQGVCISTGPV